MLFFTAAILLWAVRCAVQNQGIALRESPWFLTRCTVVKENMFGKFGPALKIMFVHTYLLIMFVHTLSISLDDSSGHFPYTEILNFPCTMTSQKLFSKTGQGC